MEHDGKLRYSRQELLQLLHKRDHERKLGLVWERDDIEHEQTLDNDFVTLELDEKVSVGVAPFQDLLIEGDNFDALCYLHMAYKGRIKCIYIDPPYNTGEKDWVYNDHYVDKDDAFRHSMWLEFMYRWLSLAKDLLTQDGVIFVSIGEDEFANLSLLMEQVFPGMKVGTFVWRRRSGANDEKEWFISVDHEYVLCSAMPIPAFLLPVKARAWMTTAIQIMIRGVIGITTILSKAKDLNSAPIPSTRSRIPKQASGIPVTRIMSGVLPPKNGWVTVKKYARSQWERSSPKNGFSGLKITTPLAIKVWMNYSPHCTQVLPPITFGSIYSWTN